MLVIIICEPRPQIEAPLEIRHDNTLACSLRDYRPSDHVHISTNPPFDGIEKNSPYPTRYRKSKELRLYERFFQNVITWLDEEPLIQPALALACQYGLGGMDALHLAAALQLNAEFIAKVDQLMALCDEL